MNREEAKASGKGTHETHACVCISKQAVLDVIEREQFKGDAISEIEKLPSVNPQPCEDAISRQAALGCCRNEWEEEVEIRLKSLPPVTPQPKWIPVSERLPELNKPLLVTAYHRVCYAHMISESGNYGYPVFRLHGIKDSDREWVQETISHEPYSLGRIDAWMYLDIPEPYKVEPQERSGEE